MQSRLSYAATKARKPCFSLLKNLTPGKRPSICSLIQRMPNIYGSLLPKRRPVKQCCDEAFPLSSLIIMVAVLLMFVFSVVVLPRMTIFLSAVPGWDLVIGDRHAEEG